jgi:histidinol-phosphatase (PHP family)
LFRADYHIHTAYSSDSEAPIDKVIEAAIEEGLNEIAITDHIDFDPRYTFIDYDKYIRHIAELRERYGKRITITLGVEVGLESLWARDINAFTARYPFDFIIGSSHAVQTLDVYYDRQAYFGNKTKKEAYETYFKEIIKNINSCKDFNVYGHLDYITRYGIYEDNTLKYSDYADLIDSILTLIISLGKGIEINTSGFRYNIAEVYPQPDILRRYKELGGEIITIGSDSHKVKDVGDHIEFAYSRLNEAGFEYVTIFREQKPEFIKYN